MSNSLYDKMIELDADGIDFMPIFIQQDKAPILKSYTREEFKNVRAYPKSNYRYWKKIDGKKVYLD